VRADRPNSWPEGCARQFLTTPDCSVFLPESLVPYSRLPIIVVSAWFAALLAMFGLPVVVGMTVPLTVALAGLLLTGIPLALFLLVFRGTPPQTIAEVLYDVEQSPRRDR
jgi:hypothetical protein